MLAPSKGSPRQKDYVVVGGQKVYLNFIHAKRQNHSNFPIPHSLANPFVKESSLVGAVRSAPASTATAKRSPSGSRRRAEDDAAAAEPPPVILELRNQIIEHELGRRGDDDADDCEFSIEEFTPPAAAAKKRKAAEAAAAASAIKRELEAVEMKRAAAAEQDKRAEREKRREIEQEKFARQKAKGKEKAHSSDSSEEDEGKDENDDEGGSEEEEETDSPIRKRRRTTVEPARRQLPDKTRAKSAPQPSSVTSNHKTSPASPRGLPSPAKSPFTVPTSPFAAASTRSDKRTTPAKSPRTSASSSGASASSALPSAAAATSNSTGPASTSTSTSTTTTFSTTSACIPSSLDPMSSPSDEFEITSSFLATIDVLEKSVTGRWIEEKEDLDRSKTVEPNSKGAQSAARGTHERRPNGDGNDCDDEEQLERNSARAALPAVRGRTKATVGSGGVDREEVMDSQWIDSPFCMSTQAARAFAAPAPLVSRAKRWANQPAATDDGAGASTWDESPASSWSPASPSSSPLQSGFSLLPPAL